MAVLKKACHQSAELFARYRRFSLKTKRFLTLILMLVAASAAMAVEYRLTPVAVGLDYPWCVAFLPEGELLVTERPGALRRVSAAGEVGPPIQGVPEVLVRGQGGLFDVVLHPDFAHNQMVYLSYAQGEPKANATRIARGKLVGDKLLDVEVIFTVTPNKQTPQHYGGKFLFLPDGTILLTTGDGFNHREQAQNRSGLLGKTVRINADGSIPDDNPYVGQADSNPAVWTYGHRNPQGLTMDPATGTVYLHEHGPRGGDEINVLRAGKNYGWPVITYGIDYSGALVTPYTAMPGLEQPMKYWVPSIGPSGFAVYRGDVFPEWNGDLFVGALVATEVRRIDLEDGLEVEEQALFSELGVRIRDVRVNPDGYLHIVTDASPGQVIRVDPAD
jgi:glucose/arabinose dehydrogenase